MAYSLLYANGADLTHPYLSPLFADVDGWPLTFVQSGTRDLFLSNAVRMHRRLRQGAGEFPSIALLRGFWMCRLGIGRDSR
ncbi:alpha/beta hydrolase fold domain-containing protein [Pseudomonas synxantha]|uniref:alpha/beta hydrolase fold domain-containing protein n=1 Tax=Pseudomonas synxantha TaxID=47883 RepID=UPI001E457912|nr:alpha/beta hydrolase fold domain-containing protein [Pseudomonas synxantha]